MLCIRGTSHGPVSVSLSVASRYSIETAERIELVFLHVSFLPYVLHCVKRKFGYLQKQGHFPLELCPHLHRWTPDLENFATAYRSSKRVINLAQER